MKKKVILLLFTISLYIVGYVISLTLYNLPSDNRYRIMNYTIIWVAKEHLFCFVWFISILHIIKNRYIASIGTTIGCMLGIIIGELLGSYLRYMEILRIGFENRFRAYHYGAFIWLLITIISIIISWFWDKKLKTYHKNH